MRASPSGWRHPALASRPPTLALALAAPTLALAAPTLALALAAPTPALAAPTPARPCSFILHGCLVHAALATWLGQPCRLILVRAVPESLTRFLRRRSPLLSRTS